MTNQKWLKIILFVLWSTIVGLAVYVYLGAGFSITQAIEVLRKPIEQAGAWGPLLYITVYSFRSLIFFPASILTVFAGMVFGPWFGILFTLIGENISANVSFLVGRYFAADLLKDPGKSKRFVPRITCTIRQNGFLTVLIMRLAFVPFDLVGYSSGICDIKHRDFALGTLIGTLPGLSTFAFLGSAVMDLRYLVVAAGFLALGLAVSVVLKKSFPAHSLIQKG